MGVGSLMHYQWRKIAVTTLKQLPPAIIKQLIISEAQYIKELLLSYQNVFSMIAQHWIINTLNKGLGHPFLC